MNLGHLVSIVQESRNLTALVFPLPDVDDCVDYAITEAGEYLDAVLRAKRQGDKRNNDKAHDKRHEWGQCGYMIASAIIQEAEDLIDATSETPTGRQSVYTVVDCLCCYRLSSDPNWLVDALYGWWEVCENEGFGTLGMMQETCTAFERKHLPDMFE